MGSRSCGGRLPGAHGAVGEAMGGALGAVGGAVGGAVSGLLGLCAPKPTRELVKVSRREEGCPGP